MSSSAMHPEPRGRDSARERRLRLFLQEVLSAWEMRVLMRETVGRAHAQQLPSELVSEAELAAQVVEVLVRNGAVDAALFDALIRMRPLRGTEIATLRAAWLEAPPSMYGTDPVGVPLPRNEHPLHGRVEEMEALRRLVGTPGCHVAIKGAAGIGKSALALELLHAPELRERYGQRRWFIRLDTAETATAVVGLLAAAFGLEAHALAWRELECRLGGEPALLILDNFETPWERDAAGVEVLLSRLAAIEALALVVTVRGAATPTGMPCVRAIHLRPLASAAARALFLAIAPEHAGDPCVDALLGRTAHVPLAIVLLARAAEANDLNNLLRDWDLRRTDVLARTRGEHDRLSSWAVSLELSWVSRRMSATAHRLGSLLAALPDGVARSDLEALLGSEGHAAATTLVHVGLAYFEAGRLRMLAPVYEHLLQHHPPVDADLGRAGEHYRGLLARYRLGAPGDRSTMLGRLVPQIANFDAMFRRALARGELVPWMHVCNVLVTVMKHSGRDEPNPLSNALAMARARGDRATVVQCLLRLGDLAVSREGLTAASAAYSEAMATADPARPAELAECHFGSGQVALARGELAQAHEHLTNALTLARSAGKTLLEAQCEMGLGDVMIAQSDLDTAAVRFQRALELLRCAGSAPGESYSLRRLGRIALTQGRLDDARRYLHAGAENAHALGLPFNEAKCVRLLGDVAARELRLAEALTFCERALELAKRVQFPSFQRACLADVEALRRRLASSLADG